MALTVSAVRQRVAAAITANATGWTESPTVGGPQWSGVGQPEQPMNNTFAVTTPSTSGNATGNQSDGQLAPLRGTITARTTVRVDWRANLVADDQVSDYDTAMNAEALLRTACTNVDQTGGLRLLEDVTAGSIRNIVQDETGRAVAVAGILNLIAVHPFARS